MSEDLSGRRATLEKALSVAGEAAGTAFTLPLDLKDISVVLKYYLLGCMTDELRELGRNVTQTRNVSGFRSVESLVRQVWARDLPWLLEALLGEARLSSSRTALRSLYSDAFRDRITFLVWEQMLGERTAPELRVCPSGTNESKLKTSLPGRPVVLLVFESFPNALNELFPLMIDGLVYNLDHFGVVHWQVCAAHLSWLEVGCRPRRLILYHYERDQLIETDCPLPTVAALLVLCASPQAHRSLSLSASENGVMLLNPYFESAEWADSKIVSYDLWGGHGVPTPRSILIVQGTPRSRILSQVKRFCSFWNGRTGERPRLSVQPNSGTEGHSVDFFAIEDCGADNGWQELLDRVETLLAADDVLIREVVGNVRYCPPGSTTSYACDLRVNVSFDGERYHAESGYLQVAGEEESFICSTSRGGTIRRLSQGALGSLRGPRGRRISLDGESLERILSVAESAASVFPGLGLVGIDLKLEASADGDVGAQVLDANPRPAGLTQSEFFPVGGTVCEPGVTRRLWSRVSTF